MSDDKLLLAVIKQTYDAAQKVINRFEPVPTVDCFTDSLAGMEKLDAICMVIIAIGESIKNIDKITEKKLLPQYPGIDWKGVMGMRDIISHHYFDVDAEEVFWVCENEMEPLAKTLLKMIGDIERSAQLTPSHEG